MTHKGYLLAAHYRGLYTDSKNRYTVQIANNDLFGEKAITEIDPDNALLFVQGFSASGNYYRKGLARVWIKDATTLRAEVDYSPGVINCIVQVHQFAGGVKNIQRGEIEITNGNTYADATVTAFVTAKSLVLWGGCSHATEDASDMMAYVQTVGTTTVRAYRWTTVGSCKVRYELLEWE